MNPVPEVYFDSRTLDSIRTGYESDTLPTRTVTVKTGQKALFDKKTGEILGNIPSKIFYNVYGVEVPTEISPPVVSLGEGGMARENVVITYTLLPEGASPAGYVAASAHIDLFSVDSPGEDSWEDFLVGQATTGRGTAQWTKGKVFDPNRKYFVQTVLNRGSDSEIRGERVPLPTLLADLDIDSDNNAGWKPDGIHNLPKRDTLEDQVEDQPGRPGKVLKANLVDTDGDKVPGYADGINMNGQEGDGASEPFCPLVFELGGSVFDPARATVSFQYSGSDPAGVEKVVSADETVSYTLAPGAFRLWIKDGLFSRKVADIAQGGDYVVPDKAYPLSWFEPVAGPKGWTLFVEGVRGVTGAEEKKITLTVDPDGEGPLAAVEGDLVLVTSIFAGLVPDYNHDRIIDEEDRARAAQGDIFYFWINDDDDEGETGGDDIPGEHSFPGELDGENHKVDGVRDLIDFFPVAFDVKALVGIFPPNVYSYRLKSADENLKVVFPDLSAATVKNYLVDVETARAVALKPTFPVPKDKWPNDGAYNIEARRSLDTLLASVAEQDTPPVILLEGIKPGTAPLVLGIVDATGDQVFVTSLNLSLDGVEQMFRHINLIEKVGGPSSASLPTGAIFGGVSDRIENPVNFPDNEVGSSDNFVFLHGYNVNGQQARGFYSEMFKRLYWSGLQEKFWGVSWYGFETQGERPGPGRFTPDFHINVEHARETADFLSPALALYIPPGENISLAAHSLGNVVVAGFLSEYYGKKNDPFWSRASATISNVFMIDAAVSLEAFSGGLADISVNGVDEKTNNRNMYHPDWYDFSLNQSIFKRDLWASDWYRLFNDHNPDTVTDKRELLTWRDRYSVMTKLCGGTGSKPGIACYNFFSSGEEVLATHEAPGIDWWRNVDDNPNLIEGMGGYYSFALQERLKGRMKRTFPWLGVYGQNNSMTLQNIFIAGSTCGGWGVNLEYSHEIYDKVTNSITLGQLKTKPFFRVEPPLSDVLGATTLETLPEEARMKLLADCIPALTLPAGGPGGKNLSSDETFPLENTVDMQNLQNDWPNVRKNNNDLYWKHSDLEDVAYPFVKDLFDRLSGYRSSAP